jgi:hypothetical protein
MATAPPLGLSFSSGISNPSSCRAVCFGCASRFGRDRSRGHATGGFANIGCVPTISRFFGITIAMYFDDHGHPHFHARHADGGAKIRIDEIDVIDSNLSQRQLRLVLA